ncbi:MAG: PadR family transcriptional regulator [Solirubrobacterales bacterium]|nr:PadR family transcriptional regulator [Solirubrobacterales bacterium]MCB0862297.1 PadR family transcriptional regulator [Solirubrobacterales bacterium]MCB8915837.1 PadR family transcriptional regulator [Thermoleophilales bacterium]
MALKHAVLAALTSEEGSGYELSKRFDVSVANFWPASAQQVYRELDRLEAEGLVRARTVRQQKRPDKRVFRITADGRRELGRFIGADTKPTVIRDDLLVKVASVSESNAEAVAKAVKERLAGCGEKLAMYETLREALLAGSSEEEFLAGGPGRPDFGPYLALKRGISFERGNIRWAREVLRSLG